MEAIDDIDMVPFNEQPTDDLIYQRAILQQKDMAIPTDLDEALAERGVIFAE